jgi:GGDEF domain-containing protein
MAAQLQQAPPVATRSRRTLSIRARLMILALIAVVPIVLERVHNEQFDRHERIEAANRQALGLARRAASSQNDVIVSTRALLQVLARTGVAATPAGQPCDRLLKSVAEPQRWIRAVSVADLHGRIVCSSSDAAIGLDISKRDHFINAVKSGRFVLSDYFMGVRDKSPLIVAAYPQRNADGRIESVVLATLDVNWLGQIASMIAARSGSTMLLLDSNGTVLAHKPNPSNWLGRNLSGDSLVKSMTQSIDGVVTDASLDGIRRIYAFAELPGTKAHVAVGFDENEVLARVDAAMWRAFTELGSVAFLVLLSIWFGAERLLVRPIRVLAETASRIGHGEEKTAAGGHPWAAEFIPLAVALDQMAEKLDEREQELRDSNAQLRELAQIDALTALPNRRTFNERLQAEWRHACEMEQPVAVLMIDVDHFKSFNDHYGHVQGDACLRKVAGVLMSGTRTRPDTLASLIEAELPASFQHIAARARHSDFAARYGGEEFAVLLRGADLTTAIHVGERLLKGVENLLMAHAGTAWGFVSISVGAASVRPTGAHSAQFLTEIADAALYDAKRQGRNRLVAKSESAEPLRASA